MHFLPHTGHADTLPRLESMAVVFKMRSYETKVSTHTVEREVLARDPSPNETQSLSTSCNAHMGSVFLAP